MRWGFWIELRGPARLWVASITFTILGASWLIFLPRISPFVETDAVASIAMGFLGWTLLLLGMLVPMLATLYIRAKQPDQETVWHWWINFIGGLLGALVFAVPATLIFPIFFAAYLMQPNALFPASSEGTKNLWLAALFSVVGIICLVATIWLARLKLREEIKRED